MVVAIDIGGSKYMLGTMDRKGQLNHISTFVYDGRKGFVPFFKQLKQQVSELIERIGQQNISGIGISVPGPADPEKGILLMAPYSGWRNINFRGLLSQEFDLPVYVENDVNACAVGEKRFGICQKTRHFLWITLSNGIGAAVFINGALYRGATGFAGEFGHIVVAPNGPQCGCGNRGCLEAVASAAAILRQINKLSEQEAHLKQLFKNKTDREIVKLVFDFARQGDVQCRKILAQTAHYIGIALAAAVNLLNPEMVVFGGGMALSLDLLEPGIREALQSRVMPALSTQIRLEKSVSGYYAALIGAGCLVEEQQT